MSFLEGALGFLRNIGKTGFQLGRGFVIDENGKVIPPSDISGVKVGYPQNVVSEISGTKATGLAKSTTAVKLATVSGVTATTGLLSYDYYLGTQTPGGQDSLKSAADFFGSVGNAGNTFTKFFTNNPLILVAVLGLGIVLVIKK